MVQFTIGPTSEHRHLGSRIAITIISVTSIGEVYEGNGILRRCSIEVGTDTCTQGQFTTAAIVHLELDGAQGTIVLTYTVDLGGPEVIGHGTILIEGRHAMSIGTVDKATILPVAP